MNFGSLSINDYSCKLDECILANKTLVIFGVTETYTIHRNDRPLRMGGGVCIYISSIVILVFRSTG